MRNLAGFGSLNAVGAGISPSGVSLAGRTFKGTSSASDRWEYTPASTLTAGTILAVTSHSAANPGGSLWLTNNTENDFAPFASDSSLYFNTWASSRYISGAALPTGSSFARYVVCARGSGVANTHAAFVDGRLVGSTSSTFTVSSVIRIGANGFNGGINAALYLLWDRALSDAEIREISANPWQVFEPRRIWMPATAGAASTYTLSNATYVPGSITASGVTPRVTVTVA